MSKTSHKGITVLLLAVLALSGLGPNMVLCIAADGHISVEPASGGECCSPAADTHRDCDEDEGMDACEDSDSRCCYQCVDIPIPAGKLGKFNIPSKRSSVSELASLGFSYTRQVSVFTPPASRADLDLIETGACSRPDTTVVLLV